MTNQIRKILLLAANPKGSSQLRLDQEVREIKEGLKRSRHRDQYSIVTAEAVRYRDIHRAILEHEPHIIHFSGHGSGEDGLLFEDESGQIKLVDAEALAGLFQLFADQVQCVVLNACYSKYQAVEIARHIDYVVGMSQEIGDRAAIEFAVGFYDALGADKGKAISLKGFQIHEVQPLERGLEGKFSDSQAVMKEILYWTGGQPFLTQKLCQFMVEESLQENPRTVEQVVRSRIIESWESQDEPEHLRTIRARILRDEQRAGYLLELYQQVRSAEGQSELQADNTLEQSELQLSGLVVRLQGKLRVYNAIYQEIFDSNWVENQLKNLRPYSESFRFWVASGGTDESRLLRGKALQEAEEWAEDKNLSYQDKQFLAASKNKEIQEEIAFKEKEAALERERKDREAAEQRNQALAEANKKARQRIRNGTVILVLTLLGAAISVIVARNEVNEAQQKLKETYTYVAYPQQLKELAGKFPPDSQTPQWISKKAAIKIKDGQIEQVYLHASKSLAYQYLGDLKLAEESIKQSMNFLRGWKENKEEKEVRESKSEFLQIEIFALTVQGNLLSKQNNTQKAIDAYKEAFNILQSSKINHFNEEFSSVENGEFLSKSLSQNYLDLLATQNKDNLQLEKVRVSLKEYSFANLEYFLKAKQWKEADEQTYQLMLNIAKREKEGYLDYDNINSFSCPDLKRIDQLWVKSDNRFGFRVQKEIWINTGNKLGIKPGQWNLEDDENYLRFAKAVGWYDDNVKGERGEFVEYDKLIQGIKKYWGYRGSLPLYTNNISRENQITVFSRTAICKL